MGHSSVTITEQHYAALSNQSAREAISMLDVLSDLSDDGHGGVSFKATHLSAKLGFDKVSDN